MLIRFEPGLTEEEREKALVQAIEKAGPDGYVVEPRCCNVCGEQQLKIVIANEGGNDNNAPEPELKLSKFQCRLCCVYYNMCDDCIDDQYEHYEQTKCPIGYGCRNDNEKPYIFITKSKNLSVYDSFGVNVCREYTVEELQIDEIQKVMARGMCDVLCTYAVPNKVDFLFYIYYVKDRNDPVMREKARFLRGYALLKHIRPALGKDIMNHVLRPIIQREVETESDWARFGILYQKNISDLWTYHLTNLEFNQGEIKKAYVGPKRKIYEFASWSEYQFYGEVKHVFIEFINIDQSGTEDGKPLMLSFCWANGDELHIRRRHEKLECANGSFEEVFIPFSIITDDMWDSPPFSRFSRKPRYIHSNKVRNGYHFKPGESVMCFISRTPDIICNEEETEAEDIN